MRRIVLVLVLAGAATVLSAWRRWRPPARPTPNGPPADDAQYVDVDGLSYQVRTRGVGPPVVLLHGFLSTAAVWDPVVSQLESRFHCVTVDLPGFGRSAKGDAVPRGVWGRAEWLRGLLDAMGLDAVTLVGASMGGQTALAFASRYPERVVKLVLIAPFAREPDPYPSRSAWTWPLVVWLFERSLFSRPWIAWRQRGQMVHPHRLPHGRIDDLYRQTQTPGYLEGIRRGYIWPAMDDLRPGLRGIQAPTLVLWGSDDRTLSVELGREIVDGLPNAILRVITSSGHSIQLDQPQLVAKQIEAFNDDVPPVPRPPSETPAELATV